MKFGNFDSFLFWVSGRNCKLPPRGTIGELEIEKNMICLQLVLNKPNVKYLGEELE